MPAAAARKPVAEREITITHVFDAPRDLVFRMWTEADHIAQWWGPRAFTNPVCEVDARPGGSILIHMRAPDGNIHPMGGTFHEIDPPKRLVFTSFVDTPGGRILEGRNTVTFEEQGGKTKLTLHAKATGFVDFAQQMLAGMEPGWTESLDKLEELVARSQREGDSNEKQIRDILADRTYALFGKRADIVVKHLAEDIVSYDLPPPLQFAGAAARDEGGLKQWFDTWEGPIAWSMHDLKIAVGGDLAYAHGLGHLTGKKVDGENVDVWVRYTGCYHKTSGAWRIAHQHTSVPFYMDGTYKAAVDLKPA